MKLMMRILIFLMINLVGVSILEVENGVMWYVCLKSAQKCRGGYRARMPPSGRERHCLTARRALRGVSAFPACCCCPTMTARA